MVNMGEIFAYPRISDLPMERVQISEGEAKKFLLNPGDLLFARQSLVLSGAGKCSIFLGASEPITFEGHLIRVRLNEDIACPTFYYYFFGSVAGRQAIESIIEQVAAAGVRGSDLAKLLVPYPPLPEQRAIAHILGTLDDKIELNRKMNKTLEAMAQALFKNWFVDFEPFRNQGMEDSPLGPIPRGWNTVTIDDIGNIVCGKTPSTRESDNYGGNIPFITIPDMHKKVFVTVTTNYLSEKGALTQSGKLLPKYAVCVSCIATPGLVALTSEPSNTNQQINSIICNRETSPYWCYLAMNNLRQEIITGGAGGSATLNLNKTEFSKMQTIKPNQGVMWKFHQIVEPLFVRVLANELESTTLASIRDALLPKLLSGEVRVKDAERFAEEVM